MIYFDFRYVKFFVNDADVLAAYLLNLKYISSSYIFPSYTLRRRVNVVLKIKLFY